METTYKAFIYVEADSVASKSGSHMWLPQEIGLVAVELGRKLVDWWFQIHGFLNVQPVWDGSSTSMNQYIPSYPSDT
jgi:hypothetical protein